MLQEYSNGGVLRQATICLFGLAPGFPQRSRRDPFPFGGDVAGGGGGFAGALEPVSGVAEITFDEVEECMNPRT